MDAYLRLITFIVFSTVVAPVSGVAGETWHGKKPRFSFFEIALFSWRSSEGTYKYALMLEDDADRILRHFDKSKTIAENISNAAKPIDTLAALKHQLLRLPRNSTVNWFDDRSYGLIHPPEREMDEICRFAKTNRIDLLGCY